MSAFLQVSLGVVPAFLVLLAATLIQRKKLIRKISAMVLLVCVAAGGVVLHFGNRAETVESEKEKSGASLDLVYAFLAEGDTAQAEELQEELMADSLYVDEYALCSARIRALRGDYTAAKLLYEKALNGAVDEDESRVSADAEYQLICTCLSDSGVDSAIYNAFGTAGLADGVDAAALMAQADAARAKVGQTLTVSIAARAEQGEEELRSAVQLLGEADALYSAYLHGESADTAAAEALLTELNRLCKKETTLRSQSKVRLAQLKLRILLEDFDGIAKAVDEDADYNELLVVSELYLNEYLEEDDFSSKFGTENTEMYETVLEKLEQLYQEEYQHEGAALRRQVKNLMSTLQYSVKHPALAEIEKMLSDSAESGRSADATKIYLQLARLAQSRGSSTKASGYLTGALNTVGDCTDPIYTDAMYEIIGIIRDKDDTEALKNVAQYVETIVENSTTLELVSKYKEQNPTAGTAGETGDGTVSDGGVNFNTYFSDYISQKRTSLNIISLDASGFPEISFELSVDSDIAYTADQLQSMLALKDCGATIGSFTVEDITYDMANIVLVCDTSGSMAGEAIEDLRSAVSLFVGNQTEKERIGLVTFESYVTGTYGLDATAEELNAVISSLRASGGTNMYDAMISAVSMLTKKENELNIIILLSDGHDNDSRSSSSIQTNVVEPALSKGTVIYSIGLGDSVNSSYLDSFASPSGGSYLYVSDSQTLASFYEYLHNLAANRYKVTFTAYDTFSTDREVKVSVKEDELSYDTYQYSLNRDEEDVLTVSETIVFDDKVVSGLDTRLLYKSKKDQTVHLLCENFTKNESVSVQMRGKLNYDLTCVYVDESHYELTIPSGMAVGSYDMVVTVNGKIAYFENEFVLGDEEAVTEFGPYSFTSTVKEVSGDSVRLSGYVCMNGWLYFNGTVTLTGDLENGTSVTLSESGGSYIKYSTATATGLASYLAEKNRSVSVGSIGTLTLYNELSASPSSDDYRVEKKVIPTVFVSNVLTLSTPSFALYPDRIVMDLNGFTTKFPFQDDILKKSGATDTFKFDIGAKVILTGKAVGMDVEVDTSEDSKDYRTANLGSMPIYYSPSQLKLSINTLEGKYEIKFMTKVAFIEADGLGLSLKWNGSLVPTEVRVYCDYELETTLGGVPVTFSDFELGISDISVDTSPIDWTFEGVTKISVAKVSDELPKLEKYIGDVAVCSFRDSTLSFSLGQKHISLSTKFYLFDKVQMGNAKIECGKISYTNLLLGMEGEKVGGLVASLGVGIEWKSNNCEIDMGADAEIALTDKFIGATVRGNCDIEVHWWIFSKTKSLYGEGLVGMYIDHAGDLVFTVRARSQNEAKRQGINITWSKANGKNVDTKYY